jgi:hypothetical protein
VPDAGKGLVLYEKIAFCLPEKLHPVSKFFLDSWLAGKMSTAEFLRWFHMPNSEYLEVGRCIVRAVVAA